MSEVVTGAVALNLVAAPIAVCSAIAVGAYGLYKLSEHEYKKMFSEIEATEARLQWKGPAASANAKSIAAEARSLQAAVAKHPAFRHHAAKLPEAQQHLLAGIIATQHSPLRTYVPTLVQQEVAKGKTLSFDNALQKSLRTRAQDQLQFVNKVVSEAAAATGFTSGKTIIRESSGMVDVVFTDAQDRKLSAVVKLDKNLTPTLALDLEAFACNDNSCTTKMSELVQYLNEHGVPFNPKRIRHNQPQGVLRRMMNEAAQNPAGESDSEALTAYLQGKASVGNSSTQRTTKTK